MSICKRRAGLTGNEKKGKSQKIYILNIYYVCKKKNPQETRVTREKKTAVPRKQYAIYASQDFMRKFLYWQSLHRNGLISRKSKDEHIKNI